MTAILCLAAALTAVVFLGGYLRGRPHTVVSFSAEGVVLRRGNPPASLMHDFEGLRLPEQSGGGRLEILGQGDSLELRTPGLPDDFAQRVRNVTLLKKSQLRRN